MRIPGTSTRHFLEIGPHVIANMAVVCGWAARKWCFDGGRLFDNNEGPNVRASRLRRCALDYTNLAPPLGCFRIETGRG